MSDSSPAVLRPETSGRVRAAAAAMTAAMALGLWNLAALFFPETRQAVDAALTAQRIAPDAFPAWFRIHCGLTVYTVLGAFALGVPLVLTVCGRADRGLALLSQSLGGLRQGLRVLRIFLIGLFCFKFVRYSLSCIGVNGGSFLFYGMALFEGFLFTVAMLAFRWMIRFLDRTADSACTVRYALCSGEPDPRGILPGSVSGLFVLTAVQLLLTLLYSAGVRMAAMELFLAAGFLLTGLWLRSCKSTMEWALLRRK